MTDSDFYTALAERFVVSVPHMQECGMRVDSLDARHGQMSLPFRREWLGDIERGRIHTGVVTTLVDSVGGLAVICAVGRSCAVATLDLRVDYLRPAVAGRALHCRAECHRMTSTIAFVRARVWQDGEADDCAVAQGSFMWSLESKPVA